MRKILISVIVPTYNSEKNLKDFLDSFLESNFTDFEIIINDDKRTNDNTEQLIKLYKSKLNIVYLRENIKMAQARKQWTKYAKWEILVHLDSDMKVTKWLLGEIVDKIKKYDALIIPEESFWTTFWAKCKWLEKKMYKWVREIESLRVIKKEIYDKLWWHDEKMVFSEDKDFDLRVQQAGYNIWYIEENFLWHNEWDLKLFKTLLKKKWYSNTANIFAEKHPKAYRWQINIFNRYLIFFKNIKYFFKHPLLYIWTIYMKTMEFGSWAIWVLLNKIYLKWKK